MQTGNHFKYLFGNIIFDGSIKCITGLHIGGSSDTVEIGGIDSAVIRNPLTHEPYIPGSSLKGKLRSIVEKIVVTKDGLPLMANRHGGDSDKKVWRHECDDFQQAKNCPLCRIFGCTGKDKSNNYPSVLLVRDGMLSDPETLKNQGMVLFEVKTENSLDRLTSAAHPRTFERVPAGAEFNFSMVYRVELFGEQDNNGAEVFKKPVFPNLAEDISNILKAMAILERDGLGGNISRGYGQIEFNIACLNALNTSGVELSQISDTTPEGAMNKLSSFVTDFVSGLNSGDADENCEAQV